MESCITGNSLANIAPQNCNRHGTCSIGIIAPDNVDHDNWFKFMQETTDEWLTFKDTKD